MLFSNAADDRIQAEDCLGSFGGFPFRQERFQRKVASLLGGELFGGVSKPRGKTERWRSAPALNPRNRGARGVRRPRNIIQGQFGFVSLAEFSQRMGHANYSLP